MAKRDALWYKKIDAGLRRDSNHGVPMSTSNHTESEGGGDAAKNHLKQAEAELRHAVDDLEKAESEIRHAEADLRKAEKEVAEAECEKQEHPDLFQVEVLYNGTKKPFEVRREETVKALLDKAINAFGPLPNPHTLSLYNAAGDELNDAQTIAQAGVKPRDVLLLRPSKVKGG